ncbi:cutinase family protein [Gordonia aichiensis]
MSTRAGIRRSIAAASSLGIAAIAAVLLAIGQTSGAGVARAETETDCGDGALVLVGGTWDPDAHLLDGVTRQTQYAGYTVKRVEYPASIWPLGSFGFDNSQAQGVAATLSTVQSYQASCEGKPVVIAGYSQGAGIAGDVLTDIGTHTTPGYDISSEGVSGLLYSDPRQAGNLYGQGIELVMIGVIPGLTMAGGRSVDDFGGVPVTTVCFSGDPICDLPDPLHDPIGALDGLAGYWVKHGLYPLYMYLPTTNGASWDAWGVKPLECVGDGQVNTCMLVVPSSAWVLTQQFVDDLGLDWTVPDLVSKRWRLPDILGITLGDFQPPIRWAMGWLPQLPELGYGVANLPLGERLARAACERCGGLRAAELLSRALLWQGKPHEADEILARFDPDRLDPLQVVQWGLPRASLQFWSLGDVDRAHQVIDLVAARVEHPSLRLLVDA